MTRRAIRPILRGMKRARTLTGLFFQFLGQRWGALGKAGKVLVVTLAVLGAAAAVHFAACAFGCPLGGPCQLDDAPCHGAAMESDEPCPYEAERAREAAADEPCHTR